MPAVRSGLAFRRDPLGFLLGLDEDGDIVRFRAGFTDFTLIRSPEAIYRVLVKDNDSFGEGKWTVRGKRVLHDCLITQEGEPHRQRRLLLQPSFDRRRLVRFGPAIVERTRQLEGFWRDGQAVDVRHEMSRLALAIVGDAIFSVDLEPQADELVEPLVTLLDAIPKPGLPGPGALRLARAQRLLDATADRMIAERRAGDEDGDDLLAVLLAAGLTDEQVKDEIVALLQAGIDTTPGALAWAWLLLSRNPVAESRLHAELEQALGGRSPRVEDLPRLTYLAMVIDEVLRLYPPVHFIDRRPLAGVELAGCPVRAGSYLLLSPLLTHRDPRFFPEPAAFRPERWSEEQRGKRPRYSFFPFGGGPHVCIGEVLAGMELALVIATLAQRWRLRPVPGFPSDPSPRTGRLPMIPERR